MALELASKSCILYQKLAENDQIIDLAPSRMLLQSLQLGTGPEGGMGEHPAGRKADDPVLLLEFLMENDTFGC